MDCRLSGWGILVYEENTDLCVFRKPRRNNRYVVMVSFLSMFSFLKLFHGSTQHRVWNPFFSELTEQYPDRDRRSWRLPLRNSEHPHLYGFYQQLFSLTVVPAAPQVPALPWFPLWDSILLKILPENKSTSPQTLTFLVLSRMEQRYKNRPHTNP